MGEEEVERRGGGRTGLAGACSEVKQLCKASQRGGLVSAVSTAPLPPLLSPSTTDAASKWSRAAHTGPRGAAALSPEQTWMGRVNSQTFHGRTRLCC